MTQENLSRSIQTVTQLFPVVLFACALYIVHSQLTVHDLTDILATLKTTPLQIVSAALLLTVINYLVLAGYGVLFNPRPWMWPYHLRLQ